LSFASRDMSVSLNPRRVRSDPRAICSQHSLMLERGRDLSTQRRLGIAGRRLWARHRS
jgi:hypothetical protein